MSKNHIGRFMLAAGAVIQHPTQDKILIAKREAVDHQNYQWELIYGRIDNHEELAEGLQREVFEETGLKNVKVIKALHYWHIYRGKKQADLEIYGMTFVCQARQETIKLCKEHSEYKWTTPQEALKLIKVEGIKTDVELYLKYLEQDNYQLAISDINNNLAFF